MGLKKSIQIASLKILGVQIRPDDSRWNDISLFKDSYGQDELLEAFESWCESRRGEAVRYPLSDFVRVAPGLLNGTIHTVSKDPGFQRDLDELCADLYTVNSLQAFTGKDRDALALLLKTYTKKEILSSYIEYTISLDDFELKRAARTFAQGGATAVILSARKQKIEIKKQEELIERTRQTVAAQPMIVPEEETEEELP